MKQIIPSFNSSKSLARKSPRARARVLVREHSIHVLLGSSTLKSDSMSSIEVTEFILSALFIDELCFKIAGPGWPRDIYGYISMSVPNYYAQELDNIHQGSSKSELHHFWNSGRQWAATCAYEQCSKQYSLDGELFLN
ncbi:hypothetical protein FQR65_LT03586 [Abscondita terminalis]|nr:hypothetical protein FQR65_LT03586 [Abscondita terminalis]